MKTLKSILLFALAVTGSLRAQNSQTVFNPVPTTIVGQGIFQQQGFLTATAPNLVEGRELSNPQSVVIDASASPPILYVADAGNNRVLAWKNAAGFTRGDFADKVIGQRDLYSTAAKGPFQGSDLNSGLSFPTALAVDKSGNLYVSDTGNNRILRYPAPFQQTSPLLAIDLVIGQPDVFGRAVNQGQQAPSNKTLAFTTGGLLRTGLAFDAAGNLWASDPGNNRVLRFPSGVLAPNTSLPAADLVLGQNDFTTSTVPTGTNRVSKNTLIQPSGLAFDPQGRLFVADDANRVLVYPSPFAIGELAARIMGVILQNPQGPPVPTVSASTLGLGNSPPSSIFFAGNNPFVVDTANSRILKYAPFDQWDPEAKTFSPPATAVFGQTDFTSSLGNASQRQPSASTVQAPTGSAFFNNELYLADTGNNRVLVVPLGADGTLAAGTRLLGQIDFKYNSPNFIEGREFFLLAGFSNGIAQGGGSVVIDSSSNPPHMYVSDPLNNRVLGFRDYRKVKAGVTADLVIGQPDLFTAEVNYPINSSTVNDTGLFFPQGLALDKNSDLWVVDAGNGRVLRFSRPFDQQQTALQHPNLVIGQSSFFTKVSDASSQTMGTPVGIAFTNNGHLLVSDAAFRRVLFFRKPTGGDFTTGQFATTVIGQPDFGPPTENSMNSPHLIATDVDDRLYVADTGNNRILIYRSVSTLSNDPTPSLSLATGINGDSLNHPHGVFVSPDTEEVWVADTLNNRLLRYPGVAFLNTNSSANTALQSFAPLAVTLDPFGNPVAAEGGANRVAFYSPQIDVTSNAGGVATHFSGNGANYLERFAPGMLASIFASPNSRFGDQTVNFNSLPNPIPIPTTLGDLQVLVNGVPAPLLYVSPAQINLQIPAATPAGSQGQDIRVVRVSTGQIVASALFRIDPISPGLFTSNSTGNGQLAATNQDGAPNDAGHPAKAGSYITLYGTGLGVVGGQPADGVPATGVNPTSSQTKVFINGTQIPDGDVQYSGLAPGFVGVWQINAKVPANVPPQDVSVVVTLDEINSNLDQFNIRRQTTIRTIP